MKSGRNNDIPSESGRDENDSDRLRRTISPEVMSVELVSAFAGDREMTEGEKALICTHRRNRGGAFYSDLFFAISHHYFAPEIAEALWEKVLAHKHITSERLGRNVRITVAALDYLSNITSELTAPTLISEAYISEIVNLSMRDGMTGLYNHSTCYELLELEFRSHRRYGRGISLLLLDIDDFKLVNDRNGHQQGDRILIELARTLIEQTRDSDICCRFGGEEFVVILPLSNDPNVAREIAERIRTKVTGISCGWQQITVSVGVAVCNQIINSPRALIERADQALYQAKKSGKNRVVLRVVQ
ncbi:MAG: GGDEF domain-containing protein [Deltaproteobacteria bacterium]|nr:GGDEF domain-containing protein [Deltaproteobacteria bacterium]